ncbi:hypothetical protein QJQ45_016723 [Haematococcus lacustris]|nr:hypothetical protein QJQ45_016723 [Haematococcus lacustris]
MMQLTLGRFPATAAVKEATGLPFSAVVQPLAPIPKTPNEEELPFGHVPRCASCYAYINRYCNLNATTWQCAVCTRINDIRNTCRKRYAGTLALLPELRSEVFECVMDATLPASPSPQGDAQGPCPVYLALVDVSGDEDFLEVVRSGLLAALEVLPPYTQFGLITFSNKVGLHDLRSGVGSVRLVHALDSQDGPLAIPLAEVMPLHALLAPVGQFKESISGALDQLAPDPCVERDRGGEQGDGLGAEQGPEHANGASLAGWLQPPDQHGMARSSSRHGRGLGPALLGVLQYLQAVMQPPFTSTDTSLSQEPGALAGLQEALPATQSPVHLMTFLSGPPNFGAGRITGPGSNPGEGKTGGVGAAGAPAPNVWQEDSDSRTAAFYEQAAVAAAALGVCCDLYALSSTAVGLAVLEPLCNSTGGALYLYAGAEDCALPQDMYRRLCSPQATSGLLRVRTSKGFKPVRYYGRLFADQQARIENLHHVVNCSPADCYALDFEVEGKQSLAAPGQPPPTIQIAFQYTVACPCKADPAACIMQRRVRVLTTRVKASEQPLELMRHAATDASLALLLHKIMRAARSRGTQRARPAAARLAGWTGHKLPHSLPTPDLEPAALQQLPVDLNFAAALPLQAMPRLVYALLRSLPLHPHRPCSPPTLPPSHPARPSRCWPPPVEGQHPDLLAFLEHMWGSLPPGELVRAVYPVLSSWADNDTLVMQRHSLSRGALLAPDAAPIFLLDAYIVILVLFTLRAPPSLPFPPPQQSQLRKTIAAIRQERKITPMVKVVREGTEEAELFHHLLLDEPDRDATGAAVNTAAFGLLQFLDHITVEVSRNLRNGTQQAGRQ